MKFECPHCHQRLSAEADMVGQKISCPACANSLTIPAVPVATSQASTIPALAASAPAQPFPVNSPQPASRPEKAATTSAPTRKSRMPVLAMAACFLILGGVVAAFFVFRGKGGSPLGVLSAFSGPPPSEIRVYPTNVNLSTGRDRQSVVVQAIYDDGLTRDVTADAAFSLRDRALAKIENGIVSPLADGKTELQVKFGGKEV